VFAPLVLVRLSGVLSARSCVMRPELMLSWPVVLTNYAVVLNPVLKVPFTLRLVCFCNMVLLLVGVCYLWMHPILLIALIVLHCCGMCMFFGLAALDLFSILIKAGQH